MAVGRLAEEVEEINVEGAREVIIVTTFEDGSRVDDVMNHSFDEDLDDDRGELDDTIKLLVLCEGNAELDEESTELDESA